MRTRVAAEPTSLLELQPSVEWDRAQHSLMEADEPFYIQRATGVRGDVKVADDLYCGALTNPDGDIFCSGDLCAARIHPRHSPGRLEVLRAPIPTSSRGRRCNDGHVIADRLEASLCQADSVDVDALVTGPNTLTVDSLRVSGALSGVSNTSCDEVEVGGTRQWAGVFLQTFDDVADATSWHGGLSKVPCCCHHGSPPWPAGAGSPGPWPRCALGRGRTFAQGPMGGRGAILRLGRRRRFCQGNGQPITSQTTIKPLSNAQARWPCLRVRRRRRAGRRLRRRRRQHQRQRRWRRRRGQPRGGGAATAHGAAATRELPVRGRVARRAAALQPLANPCKPARPFPALPRPVQS